MKSQPEEVHNSSDASIDEYELARSLQAGDSRAIETLYTMYFDRLYAFVFQSVNHDHAATEDIIQEIFVSAIRSAKGFKGRSRLYTWLAGIAHHKIYDYFRLQKKELTRSRDLLNNAPVEQQPLANNGHSAQGNIESAELRLVLEKALLDMPLDYREVLLFKYIDEMTVLEISQAMDRSPKAVDGLLTRARKLLKRNIEGKV